MLMWRCIIFHCPFLIVYVYYQNTTSKKPRNYKRLAIFSTNNMFNRRHFNISHSTSTQHPFYRLDCKCET